jgi:hypothetical protein
MKSVFAYPGSIIGVLLLGLLCLVIASTWQLEARRTRAQSAAADLAECHRLAAHIARLRAQPHQAGLTERSARELAQQIEQAAQQAGVAPADVIRINPRGARRISNSVYKQQSTDVAINSVTMKELITFLSALTSKSKGLQISSLRLLAEAEPALQADSEEWDAEVTLTFLIFSPTSSTLDSS